jgi:hypothetical protein
MRLSLAQLHHHSWMKSTRPGMMKKKLNVMHIGDTCVKM